MDRAREIIEVIYDEDITDQVGSSVKILTCGMSLLYIHIKEDWRCIIASKQGPVKSRRTRPHVCLQNGGAEPPSANPMPVRDPHWYPHCRRHAPCCQLRPPHACLALLIVSF